MISDNPSIWNWLICGSFWTAIMVVLFSADLNPDLDWRTMLANVQSVQIERFTEFFNQWSSN